MELPEPVGPDSVVDELPGKGTEYVGIEELLITPEAVVETYTTELVGRLALPVG